MYTFGYSIQLKGILTHYFTVVLCDQCKYKDAVFTTLTSLLSNYCITVTCFGHLSWPSPGFSEIIIVERHEHTLLNIPSKWWTVEYEFSCCIPVKQTIVASWSFVICWCMFPPQSVRNLQQYRKCHTTALSVRKWQVYWVTGQEEVCTCIHYLWAQNTERLHIHRQIVLVYGAGVVSFQQVWKWLCGFANGGVMHEQEH
jgi:hypothetical protein